MTTTQDCTLVLKDRAGDYYVLPQSILERGLVPAERKAEIERLIADAEASTSSDGEDVQGHVAPAVIVGISGAIAIGAELWISRDDWLGPVIMKYAEQMR
jgi:hypothetical protein